MKKYEIMYIVNASLDDAAFKTVSDRLHATITDNVIRVMVVKTEGEK